MSRRKKKQQQQPTAPVIRPTAPTLVATPQAEPGKAASLMSRLKSVQWAIVLSAFSLIVSVGSFAVAYRQAGINQRQAEINQRNQDRASGKIRAKFAYVEEKEDPARLRQFIKKSEGYDEDVFRMDSLDDLMRWGPEVKIRNTGEEVIDGIRIELIYLIGAAYGFGVEQKMPIPIVVHDTSVAELTTFGKLMPGQTATARLTPLVLDQMQQCSKELYPGKDHRAFFKVEVFCRIVGATTYDAIEPRKYTTLHLHWKQSVFSDPDKCNAVLKKGSFVTVE